MAEVDRRREAMIGAGPQSNYLTAANLEKRQAIFQFLDTSSPRARPALDRIDWNGAEKVLDAGCGNGLWIRTLLHRYSVRGVVGIDVSPGILRDARSVIEPETSLLCGDVQRLPFADEAFDVVLCFWMLYHVADQQQALQEIRRVLRPGGRLLATTNRSAGASLGEDVFAAVSEVLGCPPEDWFPTLSFNADNGAALLETAFDSVEAEEAVNRFVVPTPEPIIDILRSTRVPIEMCFGRPIDWEVVEAHVLQVVSDIIARDGGYGTEMASMSFLVRA